MEKSLLKSKRFWVGLIALLTQLSLIFTGEKEFAEQLPLIVTSSFTLIQMIVGVLSKDNLTVGGKPLS